MKFVLFYHSLLSDWNHGNAHFLRGVVTELLLRGHMVDVYEPCNGWSLQNLRAEHGETPIWNFRRAYPLLDSTFYNLETLDLDEVLDGADVVIVHEWNPPELVNRIGAHRARHSHYRLLFHDTHHRAVTDPTSMACNDLSHYDGVLAFGRMLREIYLQQGRVGRAWTWHEAADTRCFWPRKASTSDGDLVWVGNWGDEERTQELHEFLLEPARRLKIATRVYGVRYAAHARRALANAGIAYAGWLPNFGVPEAFARFRVTVHVPRRPYRKRLAGIPTIRPFEALACGIPLVSAPWEDSEGLFTPNRDYLLARDGAEMQQHLFNILNDADLSAALSMHGRQTILSRHTCIHRVDELLDICASLGIVQHVDEAAHLPTA
jgi:spore maturation protein CgeB